MQPRQNPSSNRWKLHARYTAIVFAFYMASIMALLMCGVIVAVNQGLPHDFLSRVLRAYIVAMPVAFVCVLFVRPLVMKLVSFTVNETGD